MKKRSVTKLKLKRISVASDVHSALMVARAKTGKPIWRIANEAILEGLAKLRLSAA